MQSRQVAPIDYKATIVLRLQNRDDFYLRFENSYDPREVYSLRINVPKQRFEWLSENVERGSEKEMFLRQCAEYVLSVCDCIL